jgi:type II secretory pathway component PulL
MLSAIRTKLLFLAVALLASIAAYCAYQKHQQAAEQAKVNNLMQHLRPDEKKALDATTNWASSIQKQHLK